MSRFCVLGFHLYLEHRKLASTCGGAKVSSCPNSWKHWRHELWDVLSSFTGPPEPETSGISASAIGGARFKESHNELKMAGANAYIICLLTSGWSYEQWKTPQQLKKKNIEELPPLAEISAGDRWSHPQNQCSSGLVSSNAWWKNGLVSSNAWWKKPHWSCQSK